jgi:hypothetical protein
MKTTKLLLIPTLLVHSVVCNAESTANNPIEMTVYRSPTCSCCSKWLEHATNHHFVIKDIISDDMQTIKQRFGVPDKLTSCHTAIVEGYVIEGHVPAEDIKKLLQDKPKVIGLSAPGMPIGSPGMEMGNQKDRYETITFDKDGNFQFFAEHGNSAP